MKRMYSKLPMFLSIGFQVESRWKNRVQNFIGLSSHFFAHELCIYSVHSNRRKVYKRKTYFYSTKWYKVKSGHFNFYEMQKETPYLRRTYIQPFNKCKMYVTKMWTLCDLVQGMCLPNVWSGSDTSSTPEMTSWPPLRRSKQVGRDI